MSSSFPLFRLPFVASAVVINELDLEDLMILTCCSRKSRSLAKILYKKNKKVVINAVFSEYSRVLLKWKHCERPRHCFFIEPIPDYPNYELVKIGNEVVPVTQCEYFKLRSFHFEDVAHGVRTIFEWLAEFFDKSYTPELAVSSIVYKDQVRSIVDWMLSKTSKIDRSIFKIDEISDDEYRKLLDVCSSVNDFCFRTKPSAGFAGHQFSFEGYYFSIHGAFWFTLNNLMSINARICRCLDTRLTSTEMNQYLKFWMSGGCSKIVSITVHMKAIDLVVLLDGLNAVNFPENTKRKVVLIDDQQTVCNGFDIERNDGTLATIVHHGVHPGNLFQMVVWSGL